MAQILIRDLDDRALATLKRRAEVHRRSLAQEVRLILEEAADWTDTDPAVVADRIRRNLQALGTSSSDSGAIQAEDRAR